MLVREKKILASYSGCTNNHMGWVHNEMCGPQFQRTRSRAARAQHEHILLCGALTLLADVYTTKLLAIVSVAIFRTQQGHRSSDASQNRFFSKVTALSQGASLQILDIVGDCSTFMNTTTMNHE